MSYTILTTKRFERSLKKCVKRGLNMAKFKDVLDHLAKTGSVPQKHKPHKLSGTYPGAWECHIEPDWLLVWEQNDTELVLLLLETGTHSDIFK